MTKKAITFLGTGNYTPVIYSYENKQCDTPFFAVAVKEFFEPDKIIVVLTKEARDKHWSTLKPLLEGIEVKGLDIPTGKSEKDLWEIFSIISEQVEQGDELIFDITHSFRSQPLLALLITNYVQTIKSVKIEKLVYGAFEAKEANHAPVFDLTPFVALLNWTTATDVFLKTGYATPLTNLVGQETKRIFQGEHSKKRGIFDGVSASLENLSNALRCNRPIAAMEEAAQFSEKFSKLEASLKDDELLKQSQFSIQPFTLLLKRVVDEFSQMALKKPLENLGSMNTSLEKQQVLLKWYVQHQHPILAVTLARELMVSKTLLGQQAQASNLTDSKQRKNAENELNTHSKNYRDKSLDLDNLLSEENKLWDKLIDLRNDIAHAGMRTNPRKVATVISEVEKTCNELIELIKKS